MTAESNSPHFRVRRAFVREDELVVELRDGREIVASLDSYPELRSASEEEKRRWRLIAMDEVIYWPDLDLRVSIDDLPPPVTPW